MYKIIKKHCIVFNFKSQNKTLFNALSQHVINLHNFKKEKDVSKNVKSIMHGMYYKKYLFTQLMQKIYNEQHYVVFKKKEEELIIEEYKPGNMRHKMYSYYNIYAYY